MSAKPDFAATLKQTRRELDRLRRDRAALDAQIAKLEQVEAALRGVTQTTRRAPDLSSITDVVRTAVRSAVQPITPTELRDQVLALGFDKRGYSQFLASLHVVLKRLVKNNEVFEFEFGDRKTYWWVTNPMPGGPYPENAMLGNYLNTYKPADLKTSRSYEDYQARELAKYRR